LQFINCFPICIGLNVRAGPATMDETKTSTPTAVEWYSLGPTRSTKRSLFSAGSRRRPDPVVYPEMTSPKQSADDANWQRHDWCDPGSQLSRSLSMRVRSSRNARKSYNNSSESSCQPTNTNVIL